MSQDARPEDGGASLQAQNVALRAQVEELQAQVASLQQENVELRSAVPPAVAPPQGARARPRERREVAHEGGPRRETPSATWDAVERGERLTKRKACELYPSVPDMRLRKLPSLVARQPTIGSSYPRDVHTYLLSDVKALAAQVAAELADPTWQAVERGERLATSQARELYPSLPDKRLRALPSVVARRPTIGKATAQKVSTYLRTDVEALAAQVAAELADPTWQAVERGERLTTNMALELYPSVSRRHIRALPLVVARQPTIGKYTACNVLT